MKIREHVFKLRAVLLLPLAVLLIIMAHPTLTSMLIGITVALFGELIRIWAAGYVGDKSRDVVLQAQELIIAGPYRHVRNPLYLANTIMAAGFVIIAGGWEWNWKFLILLAIVISGYMLVYGTIVPYEEAFLEKQYGDSYEEYKKAVPRWTPRFFPYPASQGKYSWRDIRYAEIHTIFLFLIMTIIMIFKML